MSYSSITRCPIAFFVVQSLLASAGAGVLALAGVGCAPGRAALFVDVKTDLVPGAEFVAVRTELFLGVPGRQDRAPDDLARTMRAVHGNEYATEGHRVAEYDDVSRGVHAVRVELEDAFGAVVLARVALVTIRRNTVMTIVLSRDCLGVVCPGADDPAGALSCLGGQCVDPSCLPEEPDACPAPQCATAADCEAPPSACASAGCIEGVCFAVADDSECAADELCVPDTGCVPRSETVPPEDAGVSSADSTVVDGTPPGVETEVAPDPVLVPSLSSSTDSVFGGAGNDLALSVAAALDGGAYVVGRFERTVDFGWGGIASAGGEDGFLLALDPAGAPRWVRTFGSRRADAANGVAVDSLGNVVVAGLIDAAVDFGAGPITAGGAGDAFVASYGVDGAVLWARVFGGADSEAATAVDVRDGQVVVGGTLETGIDFGLGGHTVAGGGVFLVSLSAENGSTRWSWADGVDPLDRLQGVAIDALGAAYATGAFSGTLDFGGGPLTSSGSTQDVFVAKLDSGGAHEWSYGFDGPAGHDIGRDIAVGGDGYVYVTGEFHGAVTFGGSRLRSAGQADAFVACYQPDGSHVWSRRFGGSDFDMGLAIAALAPSLFYVGGSMHGTADFGFGTYASLGQNDAFVLALDGDGDVLDGQFFGGPNGDAVQALSRPGDRGMWAAGNYGDGADLGGGVRAAGGFADFYAVRFE